MKHRFLLQLSAVGFSLLLIVLLTLALVKILPLIYFWIGAAISIVVSYFLHKPQAA